MRRACEVEHPNPQLTAASCRRCWLYVNVPRYRAAFDGPAGAKPMKQKIYWEYGVTTVVTRKDTLLPQTLQSLKNAGFEAPRLFVDGCDEKTAVWYQKQFSLPVTARYPTIRVFGNWYLSATELYLRRPLADRYAVFQDDVACSKHLRQYLEAWDYPADGYLNLHTFPQNEARSGGCEGCWYESNGQGLGALGLVFDRQTLLTILNHPHMTGRPMDSQRGWCAVDGGIVTAARKAGLKEYVHSPSLVQHTGHVSSIRNRPFPPAPNFKGEDFDLMTLLE